MKQHETALEIKKQARKFLASQPREIRKRLEEGLDDIRYHRNTHRICELAGTQNKFRYKLHHYRILFRYDAATDTAVIYEINTRTNIKY